MVLPIEHQYLDNIGDFPFGNEVINSSLTKKFWFVFNYFYKRDIRNFIIIGKEFWKYIPELKKKYKAEIIVGGKINSINVGDKVLQLGADQIVVGSYFHKNIKMMKIFADHFKNKVICSIDDKGGCIEKTKMLTKNLIKSAQKSGITNYIYVDGNSRLKSEGINKEKLAEVSAWFKQDFIYSGGISTTADLELLNLLKINKYIVGTSLYKNKFIKN
jgi:phosphoribosylformimino-5-aminoimidazole carboxamide ribonucleotide (ProFAR) isomerase